MTIATQVAMTIRKMTTSSQRWLAMRLKERRARRMRLVETLPLGAGRFVSLIVVEGEKFLVGGAGHSVSVVARLSPAAEASWKDLA
jgi:flagellar biogenesis protein FliO